MNTVLVTTHFKSGAFQARAGRGKKSKSASSTSLAVSAVRAAAAKYFSLDESNVQKPDDIQVERISTGPEGDLYTAKLPEL